MIPSNLKQISSFEYTALDTTFASIYKPVVYPLRVESWQIVCGSFSIYADVIKLPCELGAPGERQRRGRNIHRKTPSQTAPVYVLHLWIYVVLSWCIFLTVAYNWPEVQ